MIVLIREAAYRDLAGIFEWIARESPRSADHVVDRILANIERLGRFPFLGHAGRVADTKEWIVPRLPYIVVYRVDAERDELHVVAVFHAAQDRDHQNR